MSNSGRAVHGTGQPAPCTVTVCRGCCCGTRRKHPTVNHTQQLSQLHDGLARAGRVHVADCLNACEHSNVLVVAPSQEGRRTGARPVWLEHMLDEEAISDVVAWVNAGGPGVADLPAALDLHMFTPPRRRRAAADWR